ncbi:hypothetical protein E2C01_008409 [Portunus trituberculatus]|uniref:Uncharacterized protein n=1 Tax=Portunus trituberculatus TaxID=210409 RepID=A0A5B7D1S9_PORTR|nr:hypothetical protein [Portunus trituberculatus]
MGNSPLEDDILLRQNLGFNVLYGPIMGEEQVPSGLVDAVGSLKEALKAGRTDIFRKLLDACQTGPGQHTGAGPVGVGSD